MIEHTVIILKSRFKSQLFGILDRNESSEKPKTTVKGIP